MTFDDYTKEVDKLLVSPERGDLELLSGQLCAEAGEVFGQLTKIRRLAYKIQHTEFCATEIGLIETKKKELDELWVKFRKELGDTQFYLAAICNHLNYDLEDIAFDNIVKLKERKKNGTLTSGSGDNR